MFRNTVRIAWLVGSLMLATSAMAFGAAGGKNATSSSISLMTTSTAAVSADSTPTYGQSVTFAVSTNATKQPFVHLTCSQDGSLVLESWQAWFYGAAGTQMFRLGPSPAWQGGAAECTAFLENWDSYSKNGKTTVLASTTFVVHA